MIVKLLQIIITLIVTSFFFFPFYFTFLPTVNTKMMMAAAGFLVFLVDLSKNRTANINRDFFVLSLLAALVSFVSFLSMTINETPDDSYMTYLVSMWVWLGAAYFMVSTVKWTHEKVSIELLCFYLIAVGGIQCILALAIDQNYSVKAFIDSILYGYGFMGKNENSLYGLGCALDVAGGRFSALLIMIAYLLPRMVKRKNRNIYILFLLTAFCLISLVGNIIGRTTTIGLAVSIAYLFYIFIFQKISDKNEKSILLRWITVYFSVAVVISVFLYNVNPQWREHLRFGFEGFFSLFENGRWEVHSNDMLKSHYVFPDNMRAWIIGDGRIASTDIDPYYTGKAWSGFYMGSDVGYVRFIFYFGLTGLIAFSLFMIKAGLICFKRFRDYRYMFLMFVALNFIIWLKVSTDIFLVFAPFLCLINADKEELCN